MTVASDLLALVGSFVAIDSVNPALVPGAPGETAFARSVQAWCEARAIETTWLEATPGRPSVLARVPGTGGGRSLMFNAHLDTVGTAGMTAPYDPRLEGGRLHGRGSMDMKGSVAACLVALERLRSEARSGGALAGDVLFAAVADEEHASIGTREVLEHVRSDGAAIDAAVVTEPSDLELHVAHRGFAIVEVVVHGLASHTSQPDRGANAVRAMGRLLGAVERLDASLRVLPPHALLGHGSMQPILLDGGRELFTTPDRCRVTLERRTLPGEGQRDVLREVDEVIALAIDGDARLSADVTLEAIREPFEVESDVPIVRRVAQAVAHRTGAAAVLAGAPYWMDAALYAAAGIPTVVCGPIGGGIHAADEWVDVTSIETLTHVLVDVARGWCVAP